MLPDGRRQNIRAIPGPAEGRQQDGQEMVAVGREVKLGRGIHRDISMHDRHQGKPPATQHPEGLGRGNGRFVIGRRA